MRGVSVSSRGGWGPRASARKWATLPEGDTIFRAARTLHRALAGTIVTRFDTVLPALARVDHDHPIAGRTIDAVESRGKHLLMILSGDLILHTHMRMNGSWHLYRPGERWQRPARDMRVVLATADIVAVGFTVPVAEFLSRRQLARHEALQALGPDLLGDAFDHDEAVRRMRDHESDPIGEVLLNQRALSGVGNVFRSEILFVAGLNPFSATARLSEADLRRLMEIARALLAANVIEPTNRRLPPFGRRTTRSLNPDAKHWVYGRAGKPCRRCGATIHMRKTGLDARPVFWCPACQSAEREAGGTGRSGGLT